MPEAQRARLLRTLGDIKSASAWGDGLVAGGQCRPRHQGHVSRPGAPLHDADSQAAGRRSAAATKPQSESAASRAPQRGASRAAEPAVRPCLAFDAWMRASQVSADRPVRHRRALVRLCRPARDRAGAAGLGDRHHRAAARQVAAGTRRAARRSRSLLVTVLLVAVIVSLLALLSTPVAYWLGRATRVGALIKQKLQTMNQPLALLDELRKALNAHRRAASATLKVEQQSATVVTTIFSILTPAVSQFILFIGALVFYLVYQKRLRSTAVLLPARSRGAARHAAHAERHRREHDHLFRHLHHRQLLPRRRDGAADLGWSACPTRCCGACWPACSTTFPTSGRRSSSPRSAWSAC